MTEKIFISYAHDDREMISNIEHTLRKHGIIGNEPVLIIDPQNEIKFGDDIRKVIREQIQSANKVIIIHTDTSESSQWVNYEMGMADALNKPIIIIGKKGSVKTSLLSNLANFRLVEID